MEQNTDPNIGIPGQLSIPSVHLLLYRRQERPAFYGKPLARFPGQPIAHQAGSAGRRRQSLCPTM
jgi:hypothetical protein